MQTLKCAKCGDDKPEDEFHIRSTTGRLRHYNCRDCRSKMRKGKQEHFNRALKQCGAICEDCGWPKKLVSGRSCKDCLKKRGLRKCNGCEQVLSIELEFYGNMYQCKNCHRLRRLKNKNRRAQDPRPDRRIERLMRKYKSTPAVYVEHMEKQEGRCAICGQLPAKQQLCIDHDHETGLFRGLICDKCNLGLGLFQDRTDILAEAIQYLTLRRRVPQRESVEAEALQELSSPEAASEAAARET